MMKIVAILFFFGIISALKLCGRVAQLVEHYLDMVVVGGSNPLVATIFCSPVGVGVHTSKGLYYDE